MGTAGCVYRELSGKGIIRGGVGSVHFAFGTVGGLVLRVGVVQVVLDRGLGFGGEDIYPGQRIIIY